MKMKNLIKSGKWIVALALCLGATPLYGQAQDEDEVVSTDVDFTNRIRNYDFADESGNRTTEGWTLWRSFNSGNAGIVTSQGDAVPHAAEYWNNNAGQRGFDFYQELTGLENGVYKVVGNMWYSTDNAAGSTEGGEVGVYASTAANQVFSGVTRNSRQNGKADYTTPEIVVYNGTLRVGFKNIAPMGAQWVGMDYLKLYKTREATTAEINKALTNAALTAKMPATPVNGGNIYHTVTERYEPGGFGAGEVLYYQMSGLENGLYRIQLYAVANHARDLNNTYHGDNIARLFANDTEKDLTVYNQAECVPTNYPQSIVAEVTDGTLRYGLKNIKTGGQWYLVKNISLQKLDESDCLCLKSTGFAQICFARVNDNPDHPFEYSYDGENWIDYVCPRVYEDNNAGSSANAPSTQTNASSYLNISHNQRVFIRAKQRTGMLSEGNDPNYQGQTSHHYSRFQFYAKEIGTNALGDIYASGNVISLIDPYCQMLEIPKTCFSCLFAGMKTLVTAPRIPATTIGEWSLEYMFYKCVKLQNAPDILAPVFTTGCMSHTFAGCTKLQYANFEFRNYLNAGGHNPFTQIFDNRGTGNTRCHLWCYSSWDGTIDQNVEKHYKDASGNTDWLCLTNTGSTNATVKLNNGASFQIQYSYNGTNWFNTWSTSSLKDIGECNDCQGHCYFTEVCGTCHGNQTVACSNVNCVNGKVDCSTCGGTAKKTCPTCNGNKTISCSICEGDGLINCTICNHTGKVACTATDTRVDGKTTYTGTCNGGIIEGKNGRNTRYWQCTACGGTYDKPQTQKKNVKNPGSGQVDCSNCKGKTSVAGQLPCTNVQCTNGRIPCSNTNCNGGKVNCDNCVNGKVNCNTCGGDQLVVCGTCSGSGTKYIACTSCRGSGEAYSLSGITQGDGRYKVMESTPTTITLNTTNQTHVFFRTSQDNYTNPTFSASNHMQFVMTGNIAASGNAMTLIKSDGNLETVPAFAFYHLFEDCLWLQSAPKLPATTLSPHCYEAMFKGCKSLAVSPVLPAEELKTACYRLMFNECSNLKMIISSFRNWDPEGTTDEDGIFSPSSTNATDHWVTGVYRNKECRFDNENITDYIYDENHIPCDEEVQWYAGQSTYLTFTSQGNSTICLKKSNTNGITPADVQLVYKLSGSSAWNEYTIGTTITLTNRQSISFRAGKKSTVDADGNRYDYYINVTNATFGEPTITVDVNGKKTQYEKYYYFEFSGDSIAASGNIFSLLSYDCSNEAVPDFAFSYLFKDCKLLTTAPKLPGTKLGKYCYNAMFVRCFGLNEAPILPAQEVNQSCYRNMFKQCTKLTKCPELPAQVMAQSCYQSMFYGCDHITEKPILPAKTLAVDCYNEMFRGCNRLKECPELPATTLRKGCYKNMFYGCTVLKTGPVLNATIMQESCYEAMFYGCNNLITAPDLPATILSANCYKDMFNGCSRLRKIHVEFVDWNNGAYTTGWVAGTTPGGNFFCPDALNMNYGPNNIPVDDTEESRKWTVISNPYICFMSPADTTATKIQLKNNGGVATAQLQYSLTGSDESWQDVPYNTDIELEYGKIVLFRAHTLTSSRDADCRNGKIDYDQCDNGYFYVNGNRTKCPTCQGTGLIKVKDYKYTTNTSFSTSTDKFYQFAVTEGSADVSGDVASLIKAEYDRVNSKYTVTEVPNKYAFYGLFKDCKNMTGKVTLPFTTLKEHCYHSIFDGCENLSFASELPATEVEAACYEDMFKNCKSITQFTSILPTATIKNSCYKGMFRGCSSLTEIANTVLTGSNGMAGQCFASMFEGCSSLVVAPTLVAPGGGLADSCYMAMFKGCTSLTELPDLSAENIARNIKKSCFESMFENCTKVTKAATFAQHIQNDYDLMNIAPFCFKNMYRGCSSLTTTPVLNTAGTKDTYKYLEESCFEGMFENCTKLTQGPVLAHVNLAPKCFKRMFAGCTSLSVAPELPATVLADSCYKEMFIGCKNLRYIDVAFRDPSYWALDDDEEEPSYTYHWVKDVAPLGTFMCPSDLARVYNISHIPYGWKADDNGDYLCFYSFAGNPYLTIQKVNDPEDFTIKYSHDKDTWYSISSKLAISQNKNLFQDANGQYHDMVYVKASDRHVNQDDKNYFYFHCDKDYSVRGNVMSLLDPSMQETTVPAYAFYKLFDGSTTLMSVSGLKLTATNVGNYAYANLFNGCTTVQTYQEIAPELPATKLGKYSYENLFKDWTAMKEAPVLPAKELEEGCYNGLFDGCTSLKKIKVSFEKWVDNATNDWVKNVVDKGEFYCNANLLKNAIDRWGDANNCAAVYGTSQIPKDAIGVPGDPDAHKWIIILDVEIDYDYSTDMITLGGGPTIRFTKEDPTSSTIIDPEYLEAHGTLYENPFHPNWGHEIIGLDSLSYCAASYLATTIPSNLCKSIVRQLPIYAYPKYVGYCLAEDASQLRDALYYAQKASSKKYPVRIFLPRGQYTLNGTDKNLVVADYVSLIGEEIGRNGSIIQKDIADAAPLNITGDNVYVQDITLKNNNADGYAFYSLGFGQILHVSMGEGSKYQTKKTSYSFIDPEWETGLKSGDYASIDSIIVNGGAFNVISERDTFLLEMDEDYAITAYNSFFLTNGVNRTFTVRAANSRGAFGPYAYFKNFKHVEAKDDEGNALAPYTVTDGAGNPTTVKLNKYGYASFYYENADPTHRVRAIGASAFTAECAEQKVGGEVKLYHINDKDIIKQSQGVILFGQPNTIVEFYEDKTSDVSAFEDVFPNDLTGTVTKIENITDVNRYYGLAQNEFRRLSAGGYINPNKAFFDFGPSSGAATFRMSFGKWSDFDIMTPEHKEETGIKNLQYASKSDFSGSNITYNLLGQRTTNMKGLLVKNGKVILQK